MKKIRVKPTVRLKRWAIKAAKRLGRYLVSVLVSILVMSIVIDGLNIYFGHESAKDIATRAAVVASQVLEQGGDRVLAEKQASRETERNLAEFKGIKFADKEVEVTIVFRSRSIILKYIPWVGKFTTITASGSYSY